jgi:integrase
MPPDWKAPGDLNLGYGSAYRDRRRLAPIPARPREREEQSSRRLGNRRPADIVTTFGTYLRKDCGITDRRVVLHSLRHTVKQQLQEAGAPDSLISDMLGHAGLGMTNGTYGEAATVDRMSEWVERLPLASVFGRSPVRSRSFCNCPAPSADGDQPKLQSNTSDSGTHDSPLRPRRGRVL